MKFKSIQIWIVGFESPWNGFEPVKASVFKWHAEQISGKLRYEEQFREGPTLETRRGVTMKRVPLLHSRQGSIK